MPLQIKHSGFTGPSAGRHSIVYHVYHRKRYFVPPHQQSTPVRACRPLRTRRRQSVANRPQRCGQNNAAATAGRPAGPCGGKRGHLVATLLYSPAYDTRRAQHRRTARRGRQTARLAGYMRRSDRHGLVRHTERRLDHRGAMPRRVGRMGASRRSPRHPRSPP